MEYETIEAFFEDWPDSCNPFYDYLLEQADGDKEDPKVKALYFMQGKEPLEVKIPGDGSRWIFMHPYSKVHSTPEWFFQYSCFAKVKSKNYIVGIRQEAFFQDKDRTALLHAYFEQLVDYFSLGEDE